MQTVVLAFATLFLLQLQLPAQALTCSEQAQACARISRERGKPEFASKCLAASRIAACRRTCVFTGTDGRTWSASGDCKAH
jgi:hypothetical protein